MGKPFLSMFTFRWELISKNYFMKTKYSHELFVKVRPRICQLHRNMLNALLKVKMFDIE